jgi:hypothetical protein
MFDPGSPFRPDRTAGPTYSKNPERSSGQQY